MTSSSRKQESRYDRTLRAVMWMDGFLSVALTVVGVLASPIVATLGVPEGYLFALALTTIVCAVLLAAFGAITAVLIMLRLRAGQYFLPVNLRLPLPDGMCPAPATFHNGR
jgi:ABC-type transport system involved in cytochrome c biogenesis permease component